MKTLKELLDKYTDDKILDKFFKIYPDQKKSVDGYKKVLTQLRKMKPEKCPREMGGAKMYLSVKKTDISGRIEGDDLHYAMEFTRWQNWLNLPIETHATQLEAICYCLWEMTFMGYSQQSIQGKWSSMEKIEKKIMAKEENETRNTDKS